MTEFSDLLSQTYLGNTLLAWLTASGVTALMLLVLLVIRRIIRGQARRMAATPQKEVLELPFEALSRTTFLFLLLVSLLAGVATLELPPRWRTVLTSAVTIALCWQAGLWLSTAVSAWIARKRSEGTATDRAALGSLGIIGFIARLLTWVMVLLLTLDNLGINITALVTGLGIGGVAIALAVQNVLGDVLASLSIALDKPFAVGDALGVGDFSGTVEFIGVKSTRLRSVSGEQIIISNGDLLSSRVRNYGRMFERRVVFTVAVPYETDREKLKQIPGVLKSVILEQKDVRFDRSHFSAYGESALQFETVFFILSSDYGKYMDTQQAIFLRIHEEFEKLDVQFAAPAKKFLLGGELLLQREREQEREEETKS